MRGTALSIAVLLGIALAAAEAPAAPAVAATVTIASERTVLVGGKRHGHHGFQRGRAFHKGFARHHHGFGRGKAIHKGFARHHHRSERFSRGHRLSDAVIAKRIGKSQYVLIKPTYGRSVRYLFVGPRPLIKHGRFARGSWRW